MPPFVNYFNRCWLLYIVGGVILFKMVDFSKIDLQYLDTYRRAAHELIDCVPSMCSQGVLKEGYLYYAHWSDYFPHSMEAYNAAGYCLYHLHEYRHASVYFTRAIGLDPQNPTLYYNQALALLSLGDYLNAYKTFKKGSDYLVPGAFFNRYMILPFKKSLDPASLDQPVVIYETALLEYGELMSLTEKIGHAPDDQQKKGLLEELRQKMGTTELYYYVPVYTNDVQGKQVVMI